MKEIEANSSKNSNLDKQLNKYCSILSNVAQIWTSNDYRGKIELQELLFPKGIIYNREKDSFRTEEINDVAFVLTELSRDIAGKNKGDEACFNTSSPSVHMADRKPNQISVSVKKLSALKAKVKL